MGIPVTNRNKIETKIQQNVDLQRKTTSLIRRLPRNES